MLDKKDFAKIKKYLEKEDAEREKVIQQSREVIKLSKQIIYSLHRDETKKAGSLLKKITKKAKNLSKNNGTGIINVAHQEYVEAAAYYHFVKHKKILTRKQVGVSTESYLAGLCDLTGELVRRAVNDVIRKRFDDAADIKELVDEIYGAFLQFNLRGGELRKKFDQIKWNLKKLEDVMYDIKTKKVK